MACQASCFFMKTPDKPSIEETTKVVYHMVNLMVELVTAKINRRLDGDLGRIMLRVNELEENVQHILSKVKLRKNIIIANKIKTEILDKYANSTVLVDDRMLTNNVRTSIDSLLKANGLTKDHFTYRIDICRTPDNKVKEIIMEIV